MRSFRSRNLYHSPQTITIVVGAWPALPFLLRCPTPSREGLTQSPQTAADLLPAVASLRISAAALVLRSTRTPHPPHCHWRMASVSASLCHRCGWRNWLDGYPRSILRRAASFQAHLFKLPHASAIPVSAGPASNAAYASFPHIERLHRNAAGASRDSRGRFMDGIVPCIGYTGVQPSGCGNLSVPMGTAFPFPRQGFLAPAQSRRLRRNGNGLV